MFGNKKRKKEEAELDLYTKETQLKQQIVLLDNEYLSITKKLNATEKNTVAYSNLTGELRKVDASRKAHKGALMQIDQMKLTLGLLGNGSIITGTLEDLLTECMKHIDVLTTADDEEDNKISEKEKMKIRMNLEKKAKLASVNKGQGGVTNWGELIPDDNIDDLYEISDEDLIAEAQAALAEKTGTAVPQKNPVNESWK